MGWNQIPPVEHSVPAPVLDAAAKRWGLTGWLVAFLTLVHTGKPFE